MDEIDDQQRAAGPFTTDPARSRKRRKPEAVTHGQPLRRGGTKGTRRRVEGGVYRGQDHERRPARRTRGDKFGMRELGNQEM